MVIKNILYFNTLEDIKLIDMLRLSKKEDPYNGTENNDGKISEGELNIPGKDSYIFDSGGFIKL